MFDFDLYPFKCGGRGAHFFLALESAWQSSCSFISYKNIYIYTYKDRPKVVHGRMTGLRIDVPLTLHYMHWTPQQEDTDKYRDMAMPGDTEY